MRHAYRWWHMWHIWEDRVKWSVLRGHADIQSIYALHYITLHYITFHYITLHYIHCIVHILTFDMVLNRLYCNHINTYNMWDWIWRSCTTFNQQKCFGGWFRHAISIISQGPRSQFHAQLSQTGEGIVPWAAPKWWQLCHKKRRWFGSNLKGLAKCGRNSAPRA